ncbi:flagellar filament 41 kDa core protein [Paraliobacillus ryukyuensis]|uniref:Flagellar hook-associated protein 3 FlgL n=1 Tax=Paraliobacillus ryukyuensis TaxID=200904 RepID=A0A366EEI0_9BACI|nr:flagellar hook-associated protein FlgL [Paraliobacillus ryukyuensis]RBP00728.1 flagellar hook-associated protein 3 FlgL [Paraliobacillus ryukyuensis]
MRVTQNMLSNNMLRNLSNSYSNLDKYMEQLSTGKKITRPSQDPVVAMKGVNYRTQVADIEQFERNMSEVNNWTDNTDAALSEANKVLQRMRELAVQASNGTYEEGQRTNIAEEIDQLKAQLVEVANTQVNNKYLFNGTKTTGTERAGEMTPPVIVDGAGNVDLAEVTNNLADMNDVYIEVSKGTKIQVNSNPNDVFTRELFEDIESFSNALRSGVPDDQLSAHIGVIESHAEQVINERANIGAKMNRVELIEDRLSNQRVSAKSMMSDNEDADIEEVIINLTTQESIHRAALSSGSRVIQPTLLDFLR